MAGDAAVIYRLVAAIGLAAILFQARGVLAIAATRRQRSEGDYAGALRRLRWIGLGIPHPRILHVQGLVYGMSGKPAEAARCYRTALAEIRDAMYPVERLHACLGYSLMDLCQFAEAEQCFHRAIEAGDHTGNSQDGLRQLRLLQGIEPAEALHFAQQAAEHARRRRGGRIPAAYHAHQAWALALLGRPEEANEALGRAIGVGETSRRAGASLHWRVGKVLLELGRPDEAKQHFLSGRDADPQGKYGHRCQEMLRQLTETQFRGTLRA